MTQGRRRTIAALVELLLPEFPPLAGQTGRQAREEVTRFVLAQIEGMPRFLGAPYGWCLSAFALLPLLRHGRAFSRLERSKQRAWLHRWDESPLPPMRDFVRVIRGTALLAWFDAAPVRAALESERDPTFRRRPHGA